MTIIISVDLMGGLGNQLFQIFTTIAYAIRHGEQFVFQNCEWLPIGTLRPTYWNTLLNGLKPFLTAKSNICPSIFDIYRENGFTYVPLPTFTRNIKLHGYFQSIKYFQEEFDFIREICGINENINTMRSKQQGARTPSTAMHFRIVEYRSMPNHHPVAPYEYYVWAIKRTDSKNILYFRPPEDAAEVDQIIKLLKTEFPDVIFTPSDNTLADWEQMVAMACCDKHIIANSTFSWWGAVLAEPKSTHVCYPTNWFGPAYSYNIKDLVLPSWDGFNG
jgi:hypothetical protein